MAHRIHFLRPGVVGKDGRTSAIVAALEKSPRVKEPVIRLSDWKGGLARDAEKEVIEQAKLLRPDFVVIGPEEPLAEGIVNKLAKEGIPCVGPTETLAQLESSKAFTRQLLSEFEIPGNPEYHVFKRMEGMEECLQRMTGYVVKPDGLTGGKGVKISDAHLFSIEDALLYCNDLFTAGHKAVVIEEKLEGEEFSLMSFCDGVHVVDMIPVQDHKRVGVGDTGSNTGGMGSYSCANHRLPFLLPKQLKEASMINKAVAKALYKKTGEKFQGILYGGFMITSSGLRLLEYNARFGDPETLNVLALLKSDFATICEAMIRGDLTNGHVEFERLATVCKYVVPDNYPDNPVKDKEIFLTAVPKESDTLRIYDAAVNKRNGKVYLTGSRAMAFVGIGDDLQEAERIAEEAASSVKGPVFHRWDIGTPRLIQERVDHMRQLAAEVSRRSRIRSSLAS